MGFLKELKKLKKEKKQGHLSTGFVVLDSNFKEVQDWQIAYYDNEKGKMQVFSLKNKGNVIECSFFDDKDVFKDPGQSILEVKENKIKFDLEDIQGSVREVLKKYKQAPAKFIAILQNLHDSQIWNVTVLTTVFTPINIKISTETGKVISDEVVNFIDKSK